MKEARYSRKKLIISAVVYYTCICFGCVLNFLSPLVVAFSQKFDTDVAAVSVIFTVMNVSYLLSALASAFVYRYLNRHACVIVLVTMVSVSVLTMPHVTTIQPLYILGGLLGIGAGSCDTALITWMIELWRDQAAPFILTQHFAYSLGTIMPPIVLGPFLVENGGVMNGNLTSKQSPGGGGSKFQKSSLFIPFTIAGSMMGLAAFCQLILYFQLHKKSPTTTISVDQDLESLLEFEEDSKNTPTQQQQQQTTTTSITPGSVMSKRTVTLVILSCYVIGFYQGVELTSMNFFPTFCTYSKLALPEAAGSNILFGLTLAFAIGRGLGILIVLKIPPQFILWGDFILILLANSILFLWGQESMVHLSFGAFLLGAGLSCCYPAFYAYIERHIHITNGIVACITVSGGLVAAVFPIIVGQYIEETPSVVNYIIFCSLIVIVVCFAAIHWMTRSRRSVSLKIM